MDWALFSFEYRLAPMDVFRDLISIEAYKEAALNLILPADWKQQLDRLNRVRAVHGTTALEGNPLSEAEVSLQMDLLHNPVEQAKQHASKEQLQIRNAGLAQEWARMRFTAENDPLRISDVLYMHRTITTASDETHNSPGQFRTFSVTVGSPELGGVHRGAPAQDLAKMMDDFVAFVNSRRLHEQHPVVRALLAHFFLVTIHPFGDGNGRVSRLVEAGLLFQGGYNVLGFYGLSNYFYRHEAEYKRVLQECRAQQPFDVTPFVQFGLKAFASELKGINNFIKTKLNRVVYRDTLVKAFNRKTGDRRRVLNLREYNLLHYLLGETEPVDPFSENPSRTITFAELREVPFVRAAYRDVTPRTFYRELIRLSESGFIRFEKDASAELTVALDFGAIGKY